jgi:hypothetical protein
MIMPIAEYPFDGPHLSVKDIENSSGVFAIVCEFVDKFYLLDVDHGNDIKKAILNHERRKCWDKYRKGRIRYAVLYDRDFPDVTDEEILKKIRDVYEAIPCGPR